MKTCIICRKVKEKFSDEHVIPDAIQGYYHIHSVCTDCNSRMGSSIDNTLTNHKFIEFQRFLLNIKGKSGTIPNPFSGTHHLMNEPDKKVILEIDHQGAISPRLLPIIPNFKNEALVDSFVVRIDKKDEKNLGKIMEKIMLRNGINKEKLTSTITETEVDPYISVTLNIDTKNFKVGMLKIAYEFAVDAIPGYFIDDMAKEISKILYNCDFTNLAKQVFFFGSGFDKKILEPFQYLLSFEGKKHYLILLSTSHGLVCIVNLFNSLSIGIRLSKKTNYLKGDLLVGKNDLQQRNFKIFNVKDLMELTFTEISFGFDYYFADQDSELEFQHLSNLGILSHFHENGHIAFYDELGKIIYQSILHKLDTLPHQKMGDTINVITSAYTIDEELYIKILPQGKLYRVKNVYASRFRTKKL